MAKKSAVSGEYVITVEDNGSISTCRFYDNVIGSLREIFEKNGQEYDPKWNTQRMGREAIKLFGSGKRADVGEYVVLRRDNDSIQTYRKYDNTIGALREVAESIGFEYDPEWTTRQFGNKLVDYLNGGKKN